ncbi:DUF5606 family protein [Muribaculum intestinale]|uniref:DUF5606 family protein n=1 Tax=Muribaculum intestinale TaxID=1796646 RepID=UPI000F47682B|nr:DUF5606 domain-containing protein [Muribaculum intestinale]ROT09487.1 hypothetical protein EEL42_04380 [Muribaculaceae bacterium Isolate-100 (HZI)]RXE65300.1 hypothetical protein ED388_07900 [Muribaculaceae bacterium Isolate-007 (NCI)]
MLKTILAISGKPGLYKLVSNGRNMLIVESLATGKRTPAYSHDKIVSLGDIAIYTTDEDVPLSQVFDAIKVKNDCKTVDMSSFADDHSLRAYFKEILPDFDDERVYTNDIRKVFNWYNLLVGAGITEFVDAEGQGGEEAPAE